MRAFLAATVAAIVIAVAASFVLAGYQQDVAATFTSSAVRL
ncbi:MAG: hypothetical protein NT133_11685 [Alphaproteobacteria bacterium]|nr:hypothetical protein [Alphaproteobacteria bacterium]